MKTNTSKKETLVISLGGSIVVPESIDTNFLKEFKHIILKHLDSYNFIIVVGGGKVCRTYQIAARGLYITSTDDLDMIGIRITHANGELIRSIFADYAHNILITNPKKTIATKKPILVAAGWKPGFTTDHDAVYLAVKYSATTVINMSNISHLYTKDPKRYTDAKKLTSASWEELKKIVGIERTPGMNTPFDPVATDLGSKSNLKLIVIGNNIKNFQHLLEKKQFEGTTIN